MIIKATVFFLITRPPYPLFYIKEFIRKAAHPHPCPLPSRERVSIISPPLRGGD
jgi:hypothetical protein